MPRRSDVAAAVIGSGFIGTVHVEALRRIGVRVAGIMGTSAERAAASADRLGVAKGYADLDELLADDVQCVHVTSPNEAHHPQVKRILAAGKHVVCEKPLAMTSAESAELVELAASTGLVNAVNFNIRFYPLNQHLSELVRSGGLGDVRMVTGRYFQDWLLYDTDWNWRLEADRGGALRAVGDIGSHWLDLTSFVTGLHVESVMADLTTFIPVRRKPTGPVETFSTERAANTVGVDIHTEDVASILLHYEGGARGSVSVSQLSAGRKNSLRYEIDGSMPPRPWDSERPDELWQGHRDAPNELLLRNPALMNSAACDRGTPPGRPRGGVRRHVRRAVHGRLRRHARRRPLGSPALRDVRRRSRTRMLVGDAVLESARTGRWVDVRREARRVRIDEARRPDRPVPGDAPDGGRGLGARHRVRGPRDRLLAAVDGATRRYAGTSHIDVADFSAGQAAEIRRRSRRRACRSRASASTRTRSIPIPSIGPPVIGHSRR